MGMSMKKPIFIKRASAYRKYTGRENRFDAVAVAIRTGSPLYVADDLMDAEGILLAIEPSDDDDESPDELVGQFRQFLDSIKPEDFSG